MSPGAPDFGRQDLNGVNVSSFLDQGCSFSTDCWLGAVFIDDGPEWHVLSVGEVNCVRPRETEVLNNRLPVLERHRHVIARCYSG